MWECIRGTLFHSLPNIFGGNCGCTKSGLQANQVVIGKLYTCSAGRSWHCRRERKKEKEAELVGTLILFFFTNSILGAEFIDFIPHFFSFFIKVPNGSQVLTLYINYDKVKKKEEKTYLTDSLVFLHETLGHVVFDDRQGGGWFLCKNLNY